MSATAIPAWAATLSGRSSCAPAEIFLKRTDGTTVWVRQDKLGSQVFTSAGEAAEVAAAWTEKLHESWRRL